MTIVAIADLHGTLPIIPPCEILLIAGDIAPDGYGPIGRIRGFDPDLNRMEQVRWLLEEYQPWEASVPAKHILATPGNHDWFTSLPEDLRTRLFIDEGCDIDGKTFWFTPWVSPIGPWNYQMERRQRKERFFAMPQNLDVLVAHSPVHRVGDKCWDGEEAGCPELRSLVQQRRPKHFCFGHIHEGARDGQQYQEFGQTMAHNCAIFGRDWTPVQFEI